MLRSIASSRFVRSIASFPYRNVSAAAQECSAAREDVLPMFTEEDKIVKARLCQVLSDAKKDNQPVSEALNAYDGPFTVTAVSSLMWGCKDVENTRAVIDWASRQPGFYFTSHFMKNILRGLNAGGHLDEARKIIFEELQGEFKPAPAVYKFLAKLYMADQNLDALKELAEEMQKQGMEADDILLEVKLKESGVNGMLNLFRKQIKSGTVPSGHSPEKLLFTLCGSHMSTEALEVYNAIRSNSKDGFVSERIMSVLMKELCHAKKLDEAYSVTKHLLERGFSQTPPFRTVMDALCEARRLDEAYEIFKAVYDRVSLKGMTLVEAFCKAGNADMAMEVVDKLEPPNREARYFKSIIAVLCKRDRLEDAKKLMDKMLQDGISPDGEICNLIAEGHAKALPKDDPRRKKFASEGKKAEQT